MLDALPGALKHPLIAGTAVGGLGGAGIGYLTADKNDPNLLKKVLTGAGAGAGIGALSGALSSRGGGYSDEALGKLLKERTDLGFETAMKSPDAIIAGLAKMLPEDRQRVEAALGFGSSSLPGKLHSVLGKLEELRGKL